MGFLVDVKASLLGCFFHHCKEWAKWGISHLLMDQRFVGTNHLDGRKSAYSESLLDGGLFIGIDFYEDEVFGERFELCGWIDFTV